MQAGTWTFGQGKSIHSLWIKCVHMLEPAPITTDLYPCQLAYANNTSSRSSPKLGLGRSSSRHPRRCCRGCRQHRPTRRRTPVVSWKRRLSMERIGATAFSHLHGRQSRCLPIWGFCDYLFSFLLKLNVRLQTKASIWYPLLYHPTAK